MYPNYTLDGPIEYKSFASSQENADLTAEELDHLLKDFIENYKVKFKEKTKGSNFLVKNKYTLFPKD